MPRAKYLVIFLIAAACLADNLTYMRIDRTVITTHGRVHERVATWRVAAQRHIS